MAKILMNHGASLKYDVKFLKNAGHEVVILSDEDLKNLAQQTNDTFLVVDKFIGFERACTFIKRIFLLVFNPQEQIEDIKLAQKFKQRVKLSSANGLVTDISAIQLPLYYKAGVLFLYNKTP